MNVTRDHYEQHLAHFYGWMQGDFDTLLVAQENLLRSFDLFPGDGKTALDLGAGNGLPAIPLARNAIR